jgi:manganese transport protein
MWVTVVATLAALVVLSFNVILVLQTFGVAIPGLAG